MPITLIQRIGTLRNMAESFNLNTFLQTYQQATYDPTKQHAAAEANMEQNLVAQAEQAVKSSGLLTLTLSEKLDKTITKITKTEEHKSVNDSFPEVISVWLLIFLPVFIR